jgi:hypothetical protein
MVIQFGFAGLKVLAKQGLRKVAFQMDSIAQKSKDERAGLVASHF